MVVTLLGIFVYTVFIVEVTCLQDANILVFIEIGIFV
jgi:hypothetical protein